MTQIEKLSLVVIMTMATYCLLTIPTLVAFFTFDVDTGHYYGFLYPMWLLLLCSLISTITGNLIARHLIDKINKQKKVN